MLSVGIALSTIAGLANVLGGYLSLIKKEISRRFLIYSIAVGAGFILSRAFLGMVPEVINQNIPFGAALILVGYFVTYVIENIFASHAHEDDIHHHGLIEALHESEPLVSGPASWACLTGLVIHTFFDGASIVSSFNIDYSSGVLMFFAVIMHKLPEGFSISSIMLAAGKSRWVSFFTSLLLMFSTFFGAVITFWFGIINKEHSTAILALSTGSFIFVGASNLIPATQKGEYRTAVLFSLLGVGLYYLTAHLLSISGLH